MTKRKGLFLPAGLTCLALCFIWGNSMLSGEESGAVSGGLLSWMRSNFPSMSWLPERLLRKFGHFSEFSLLGLLLGWFFLRQGQRGLHRLTVPLLFCFEKLLGAHFPLAYTLLLLVNGACFIVPIQVKKPTKTGLLIMLVLGIIFTACILL